MPKPSDFHYIGQDDDEPIDDERHFFICPQCGQRVDKRDPGAVVLHESRDHLALPGDKGSAARTP